jgi:hypothetical protein
LTTVSIYLINTMVTVEKRLQRIWFAFSKQP